MSTAARAAPAASDAVAVVDTARQTLFTTHWLPVLAKRFAFAFRRLTADARDEAVADCTASAWRAFLRAGDRAWTGEAGDRRGLVTPTRVADYLAASYLGEGREFLGSSVLDVCAAGTRTAGRTRLRSVEGDRLAPEAGETVGDRPEALLASEASGPATRFRIAHDWAVIAGRCKPQARRMLGLLARGWMPIEIARQHLAVSPGRVTQLKHEVAQIASDLGYGPRRWQMSA